MNLLEIRTAITNQLKGAIGSSATYYPVPVPLTAAAFPALTVLLPAGDSIEYQQTFGVDPDVLLDVEVRCRGSIDVAQAELSRFLSTDDPWSIVGALVDDSTLGGVVMSLNAPSATVLEPPLTGDGDHVALIHLRVFSG